MDWLLASLNTPYLAMFRMPRTSRQNARRRFRGADAPISVAQLKILDGHLAGKTYFALDKLTLADIALAPIVKRCLEFPIERPDLPELVALDEVDRSAAGLRGGDRRQAERAEHRRLGAKRRRHGSRIRAIVTSPQDARRERLAADRARRAARRCSASCCSAWWCSTSSTRLRVRPASW